ncbi:MAG: indole-3-glycerol phosphate synthase TrpC [Ignavibacteriaceae bacterium]|jgi:indole-3-glycerol phosphate synthase
MNILNEILEVKQKEVSDLRKKYSLSSFTEMQFFEKDILSFYNSIKDNSDLSIIAEIKKASPSKGIIKKDFDHKAIAEIYFHNGANAVSVLTDVNFFQGKLDYLKDIASFKSLPLLRKDFIIDEYQIFHSKAFGADFILLISEILSKYQLAELTHAANEIGLEVLLELHSEEQLNKIDFNLNKLIGINNRNLNDFSVDINTCINISQYLPEDVMVVAESGINKKADVQLLNKNNIDAILVGEYLMRSENIYESLVQLKKWCRNEN